MAEIKFDKRNYRKHGERNKNLIEKSLKECGAGRSIVVDADGEIIAGNGIYEAAQKAKIPVREIETDGSELVVVRRTDLHTEDDKRKQLAIMDNSTSDSSEFDLELLQEDFDLDALNDFGVSFDGLECETDFPELAAGDKSPFQQMTFTFADGQAEVVKSALEMAKDKENNLDNMGNQNSNGNALFLIVSEWINGQR